MMLIAGTVPLVDLPLVSGELGLAGDDLVLDGRGIPATQGTGAMAAAALVAADYLGLAPPRAVLAGDIGAGGGSRAIYEYLIENIAHLSPAVLVLHYCLPDMPLMRRLCEAVRGCLRRPLMIADAGAMYAAKAAGLAGEFDIFTPDAAEMSFLADPQATHPAYVSRHLFCRDASEVPSLVTCAWEHHNAPHLLLVKGVTDHIAIRGKVVATVTEPDVPELEAIGGTGDTITGLVAALVYGSYEPSRAAVLAARANRLAGQRARATPATRVKEIIDRFPAVFREELSLDSSDKGGL